MNYLNQVKYNDPPAANVQSHFSHKTVLIDGYEACITIPTSNMMSTLMPNSYNEQ